MVTPQPAAPFPEPPVRWFVPALLAAAVALAYANSLQAPFIFDDADAVVNNRTIRDLWSSAIFHPPADGSTTTGRPLVNATFAVNYAVSGEHVWSYHALNVVIHALAALTLFGLVRRTLLLSDCGFQPQNHRLEAGATWPAFLTALLWALHPLQTETIVCVAQRTESLCGLLYLFTLYAFARGTVCHLLNDNRKSTPGMESDICHLIDDKRLGRRRAAWLALSVAACFAGMATKEVMVTAPLVVLLYDRTFVAGRFSAALRARPRYYAALAATWLALALLVAHAGGARGVAAGFGLGVSPWNYLLTQCDALVTYLQLALWPHPLVLDYGTAVVPSLTAVGWQATLVVSLLAATIWALVRRPALGFVGAWFFLILAPSSSFVPLVTQTIAEHRMYLSLAAVIVALTLALHRWLGARAVPVLIAGAFAAGAATFARNRDYASPLTIWSDNVAARPHARALTALGVALLHDGRPAEALPNFDRALALDPKHLTAAHNRALALLQLGRADEATAILTALPARDPGEADEFFALGNAFVREQKFAEAAAAYRRTTTLQPNHAAAHANLGNVLLLQGQPRAAITEYEQVLRLHPDDARARENLRLAREALP